VSTRPCTKTVLETALNEKMTERLRMRSTTRPAPGWATPTTALPGHDVLTKHSGAVEIDTPHDRAAAFESQIGRKRQRRLPGVDDEVLSLHAKGLTTGGDQRALRRYLLRLVSEETTEGCAQHLRRDAPGGDAPHRRQSRWLVRLGVD